MAIPLELTDNAAANQIALAATRSILDAATPFTLKIEGKEVTVEVERTPPPVAPLRPLVGLDAAPDFPRGVRARCSWPGGHVSLNIGIRWWPPKGAHGDLLGVRVSLDRTDQEIVWTTIAIPAAEARPGEVVPVMAAFSLFRRKGEDAAVTETLGEALKAIVERSGLLLPSGWRVQLCSMAIPSGAVIQGDRTKTRIISIG